MKLPFRANVASITCITVLAIVRGNVGWAEEPAARAPDAKPIVRVCVDPDGALVGEPQIATSSGNPRLDAAAIKLAKNGRYQAGKDQVGTQCLKIKVQFELRDE